MLNSFLFSENLPGTEKFKFKPLYIFNLTTYKDQYIIYSLMRSFEATVWQTITSLSELAAQNLKGLGVEINDRNWEFMYLTRELF